ncbi:hypothetical protein CLOSTHATH_05296 [Hungatella hathewayi DSM 13479]|uniref:Uncharacterized protein n=1 Tax=Hungatella hathewayi DSM 13479 TaxID=566550 RepID=D3ANU4_9FIRM|nr:hypothetical protein CLOSTHATH_05296 [Hungatella hathewayi DSM 13479]
MEGWKNMGENVKRTAEKLSSSKKVDEAREAELRAAEEQAAFEEQLNQLLLLAEKEKECSGKPGSA